MKLRKITSLTALVSFLMLVLSSVVLYLSPQGRVAYWADWRLWGLSKTEWANVHINLGLLLLLTMALHIYYNWKAITAYLKNKARRVRIFTAEFNLALAVTAVFIFGTYLLAPPFSWVLDGAEALKRAAAATYGEPPYGHAELTPLKTFCRRMNLDPRQALNLLAAEGYAVEGDSQTLAEIARSAGVTPQRIFAVIQPAAARLPEGGRLPETPPPGMGNLTLDGLCARYGLDPAGTLKRLEESKLAAASDMTIKAIAEKNGVGPLEVYYVIREAAGRDAPPADGR